MVKTFLAIGCDKISNRTSACTLSLPFLVRGPTYGVVPHQQLQIFDWPQIVTSEDTWLGFRKWDEIFCRYVVVSSRYRAD